MDNQFLFQMKTEDAIEAIARRVVELLKISEEEKCKPCEKGKEDPITMNEACAILRVSRVTLTNWGKQGIVPYHRKGNRIFFFRSEILDALQEPWNSKRKGKKSISY